MEHKESMTLDDLGRVSIPRLLMKRLNWESGDKLWFEQNHDKIILSLRQKHEGPRCAFCKKPEQKIRLHGFAICESCVDAIMTATLESHG